MPQALIPFLPSIIGGVSSIVGGKLSSGKRTSTQQNRAYRDPLQEQIQAQLADILKNALASPGKAPQWMINQGKKQVNSSYNNVLPGIERSLAKRGFETSGKLGSAARDVEIGRANSMQDLRAQLSQFADQRFQQMLQYAMQFQRPEGSNITSTQTGPSQLGSAITGIGGDIATMLNLRNLGGDVFAQNESMLNADLGRLGGGNMTAQPGMPVLPGKAGTPAISSSGFPAGVGPGGSPTIPGAMAPMSVPEPAQPLASYKMPSMDEVWNQVFGPSAYKPLWKPESATGGSYA